jgi:pentatricopeptide repeat protein
MDRVTWNVLVGGYAMHGHIQQAIEAFRNMQKAGICPDLVTWNSLLTGCVQHGYGHQALILFQQMQETGLNSDVITFVTVLKTCSLLSSLGWGRVIHASLLDIEMCSNLFVCNALIDMYTKCGSLDDASKHFHALPKRDLVSWNTIVAAYAMYKHHSMVFECLENMQVDGFQPDEVTLLCLLTACTHMGLSEMGCMYFMSMRTCHGLSHQPKHYNCIVDLLARKGCLYEAKSLLGMMPFEGNLQAWTSLLSHCKIYGEVKLGKQCFDQLLLIDDEYASSYEPMSSLYAHSGMWEDVNRIQEPGRCAVAA